jgi:Cu2+-exporting ATPase
LDYKEIFSIPNFKTMMIKDPVCGMQVDKEKAVKLEKGGKTYYFCSEHCKNTFLAGGQKTQGHKTHEGHEHHAGGHGGHHAHMIEDFKKRFWICLVATVPVLILSPFIQSVFHFSLQFPYNKFLLLIISTSIYLYGGLPFLKGLFEELKAKQPGMMTLITLAISVAYFYSALVVFGLKGEIFFWELATLIDIMLLGHWIEMRSVMGASNALEKLVELMPSQAHLILKDNSIKDIKIEELKKGDKVLVKPGEKIPADGIVIDGKSEINEALLTGESKPIDKKKNDAVIGGSLNGNGVLTIEVAKTGKDSYLSLVVELVKQSEQSKSRVQDFANRAAFWLTIIAITAGLATITAWLILGKDFVFALERMVTVMVITCPHALGLAIPLVVAVMTSLLAQRGLLIRNRTAFENAYNLQTIVFDKTGTLTKGEFGVTDVISFGDWTESDLLRKAASIEINSEHSVAKSIVKDAREKNMVFSDVGQFEAIHGKGVKAQVEGDEIYIGNKGMLEQAKVESKQIDAKINQITSQGKTIALVISKGKVQGIIGLADVIRNESRETVKKLQSLGFEVAIITGDNMATAKYVAGELGIDVYFAQVLPDKKLEKIKELQKQGKKVAMVGDGINDAPALAQADIGIAIGSGTDIAIETADIVLVGNNPHNVVDVIALSKIMHKKMMQNLIWATGYNVIAIPLAAGVLYNYGIILHPAVGAVVMSLSTIIVAVNARLISYK